MRKLYCSLFLLSLRLTAVAQDDPAHEAVLARFQTLFNAGQNDSLATLFSDRIKVLMPEDKLVKSFKALHTQMGDLKSYEFSKKEQTLTYYKAMFANSTVMMYTQFDDQNKFTAFRFAPTTVDTSKSNYNVSTSDGRLYGTLTMPDEKGKVPVVLFIAGSGPTDRDCNSALGLKSNSFVMLADSLAKAGIASVRYDKRGVGESMGVVKDPSKISFEVFVSDAAEYVKKLKEDQRFSRVYIMGHSEGSLIGNIVAQQIAVDGVVSVAGPGQPCGRLLQQQIDSNYPASKEKAKVIIDSISKGYMVTDVPEELAMVFPPQVQHFFATIMKYDPANEIRKVKCPILLVQGDNDLQVGVAEAELLKKAAPAAQLTVIKGMNHALKVAPTDRQGNYATYNQPTLPIDGELPKAIIAFVKKS
jgi:uncharacterized protein